MQIEIGDNLMGLIVSGLFNVSVTTALDGTRTIRIEPKAMIKTADYKSMLSHINMILQDNCKTVEDDLRDALGKINQEAKKTFTASDSSSEY